MDTIEKGFLSLKELILKEKQFGIATHVQPDGDGIGSVLGLGLVLKKMGKEVFLGWGETTLKIPPHYSWLPGAHLLSDSSSWPNEIGNFVSIDCPSTRRLGTLEDLTGKAKVLVNIDHHSGNDCFGQINIVDEKSPACAELIWRLIKKLEIEIDKDIATALYVGLVTDTGCFQYSNTRSSAFELAKKLVEIGVVPNEVSRRVYENLSFGYLKLLGSLLTRATLNPSIGLVYSSITQDDLKACNTGMEETENLIDGLRTVGEAKVVSVFKEMPDGKSKVSLRSKGAIDVAKIARQFGGGGHHNAAGYGVDKNIKEATSDLIKVLKRNES